MEVLLFVLALANRPLFFKALKKCPSSFMLSYLFTLYMWMGSILSWDAYEKLELVIVSIQREKKKNAFYPHDYICGPFLVIAPCPEGWQCWLGHHFDPDWNMSTTIGWIVMKLSVVIHGSQRTNPTVWLLTIFLQFRIKTLKKYIKT